MRAVIDKARVNPKAWEQAVAREAVLRPLALSGRPSPAEIAAACKKLGVRRARLYQLLKRYRVDRVASALLTRPSGRPPGSRRLPPEVETVIADTVVSLYATRQKASINAVWAEVKRLCRLQGRKAPCWHAIAARIAAMDPEELLRARAGPKAARDRFQSVPGLYVADYAYQVVQIDHTLVDLIVVDAKDRRPLQRPWLTLAIDVASRMVAGYCLTLEAPSVASVALTIQHLVLPKTVAPRLLGGTSDWPAAGLPDAIHVDNAKEFRSHALKIGAEEYGVTLVHRPVRTPRYGGHIERLIGTMMGAVHLLPGTTFSTVAERGAYDSDRRAAMTLDELEAWLALEIGRYQASRHAALGVPPRAAWDEAVARRKAPLRQPADRQAFLLDFLPSVYRKPRRDGLHLFGIRYWDDVLSVWAGRLSRPLRVVYDPRDLSIVHALGPDGAYWPVRFADLRRPPITLAEHRAAQAELKARGLSLVDEALIFETILAQRALVAGATIETKRLRRQAERRDRALAAAAATRPTDFGEGEEQEDRPLDWSKVKLFEVEEWS
jgi:putative transposase